MADVWLINSRTQPCIVFCIFSSLLVFAHGLDLCIEVKKEYAKMGFQDDSVPITAISGDQLQICPRESTCCTPDIENKLKSLSMKGYVNVSNEAFKVIKSTFISRTKKFDQFFTELLENSKKDLHRMFVRTYGLLYQQNADVFSKLFIDLKSYYKGNDYNLVDILNNFFVTLLQKMFELLNAQYQFDDDYLHCVTRHMDDLKPFGDVPQKLKLQVKRAFIAARTFVQGLAIGRDVILAMEKIRPTEACTRGLTRMMYCPHCRGLVRTKPCNNYCLNTMKGCLAHHSQLNKAWNEYIDALKMVAGRLEGPFNIETVVDPIDVKISEAIMNFQEDSATVTERIFKGCGQPRILPPQRNKRAKNNNGESTSYEDYAYGRNFNLKERTSGERPDTAAGTNLDRLVRDIKEKVQEARDFWVQLPYLICNGDIAAQPDHDSDCWNGQDRASYVTAVQGDGRLQQLDNPEVTVDMQEDSGIVTIQIYNLRLITGKLHNAYNGVEVEWTSNIDIDGSDKLVGSGDDLEGSGDDDDDLDAGSGSGSGALPDDEDERPPTRRPPSGKRPPPHRPTDDIHFGTDPKYDVRNKPKPGGMNTTPSSGVAMVTPSSLLLATLCVCLRFMCTWL